MDNEIYYLQNNVRAHWCYEKKNIGELVLSPKGFMGDTQPVEPILFRQNEVQRAIRSGQLSIVDASDMGGTLDPIGKQEYTMDGGDEEEPIKPKKVATPKKTTAKKAKKVEAADLDTSTRSKILKVETGLGREIASVNLGDAERETPEAELRGAS